MRGGEGGSRGKGAKCRYACVRTCVYVCVYMCVFVCVTDSHCWHKPTQHYKAIFHQLKKFFLNYSFKKRICPYQYPRNTST